MLILILKLSCIWRIRSILQFHFLRYIAYCHYWKIKLFLNAYYPNFNFSGRITLKHHSSPFPITTNLIQYFNILALVCHWKITKTRLFTLHGVSQSAPCSILHCHKQTWCMTQQLPTDCCMYDTTGILVRSCIPHWRITPFISTTAAVLESRSHSYMPSMPV